jgi:hypothetical protein
MVSVPVSGPAERGEMLTLIVQASSAATLPAQLSLSSKETLETRLVKAILVMVSGALPVLLGVTGSVRTMAPTGRVPNVRLLGETLATGAVAPPAPVKLTVCGLLEALSVKFSAALLAPAAGGVNVTAPVQALLGASVAPVQVSALAAKSPAFSPPIATVKTVRLAVPPFLTVSIRGGLVVPTFCAPNGRLIEERLTHGPEALGEILVTNGLKEPWRVG